MKFSQNHDIPIVHFLFKNLSQIILEVKRYMLLFVGVWVSIKLALLSIFSHYGTSQL